MCKKTRIVVGVAVALGLVAGWWWLERATRPEPSGASAPAETRPVAARPDVPTFTDHGSTPRSSGEGSGVGGGSDGAAGMASAGGEVEPEAVVTAPLTAGDILAEPDDDYVRVAKKLSALVLDPKIAMADREEALAHALNLSAGNEAEVLTPLVTNPALPDNLTETILAEALNRPLAYQADLYLAALAVRKTPEMQTLIREHLAFLTGGEDLGADPKAWTEAINTAKKDWAE